jgi:hypothetical protein
MMSRPLTIAVIAAAILTQPAQAANIYVGGMPWTGIPAIMIEGHIDFGDEEKFAAVAATHRTSVVNIIEEPQFRPSG